MAKGTCQPREAHRLFHSVVHHAHRTGRRAALTAAAFFVGAAAASAQTAQPAWPEAKDTLWTFYGQINQAYLHYDDGQEQRGFLTIDNATNDVGSNIGFLRDGVFGNGMEYSARFELGVTPRPSDEVSLQNPAGPDFTIETDDIWHAEIRMGRPGGGTLYLGQGDMTANLAQPDYSGTTVIAGPDVALIAGGMLLRRTDGTLSDRTLDEAIGTFDSGRKLRVRYDSRSFNGFSFSGSLGWDVEDGNDSNTYADLLVRYDHSDSIWNYGGTLSVSAIGDNEYAGIMSFGYLHKPSGINLSFVGTHSTIDKHYFYFKAGIIRNLFSFGATALSVDWYNNGNWATPGAEVETFGLSIVQNVDRSNLQIYAMVRNFDNYTNEDLPNESFLKGEALATGLRWTF
jgi:hypothetical protein